MAVTSVVCLAGVGNEQRWWQWMETSTERTEGISIVGADEERFRGVGVGNIELLGNGVCLGNQGLACSERGRVVHPGVATLDGRVSGEEV